MSEGPDGLHESVALSDHARSLLPQWNVDPDAEIVLMNVSENTTFAIGADHVLRIHRAGYSSAEEIDSELAWLQAVRNDTGVVTPEVVKTIDRTSVVRARVGAFDSDRFAVMFRRLPGIEPTEDRLVDLFEPLGQITARLHQHARTWVRPKGFTRRLWDTDHSIGEHEHWGCLENGLGVGENERLVLRRCAEKVNSRLAEFGTAPDRFGLVHADLRLANLLVDSHGGISVLDFDDSGFSWFGYDLGASLSFIEDHRQRADLIDAWSNGYRSVAPLEEAVEHELMTFIMLRRLVLTAWFGTHPDTELAKTTGLTFADGSCRLSEEFLTSVR